MKKVYLLGALSGLLLASCANDELVVKPAANGEGNAAITFQMKVANQSRVQTENLNNVIDNFGVWAIKAADDAEMKGLDLKLGATDMNAQVVMNDYKVLYTGTPGIYGSMWDYVTENWTTNPDNLTQYLKYWDGSYAKTYFFAYGPHNTVDATADDVFLTNGTAPTLTFPKIVTTSDASLNYVYADVTVANNRDYTLGITTDTSHNPASSATPAAKQTVPLKFHRLLSQVQIAFWESIPGYKVEIESLTFDGATENEYVYAIPADLTPGDPNKWVRGKYNTSAKAVVTYSGADLATTTVAYSGETTGGDDLLFDLPDGVLGETRADAVFSDTRYNVVPSNGNSGLQFLLNYVIKADDTNEEIHVKGARVYVPADYTKWAANTVYTYYFQITKDSSGTTNGNDPIDNPDEPYDALYPIIFDNVTITSATAESDWVINQNVTLSQTAMTIVTGTAPGAITATLSYLTDDNTNQTVVWTSTDETVATVTGTPTTAGVSTGTITAVGEGTATITATNNGITSVCTVTVTSLYVPTTAMTLAVGDSETITAVGDPNEGTIGWASSDDTVATVDATGKVTAVATGTANITITLGSETRTVVVTVE